MLYSFIVVEKLAKFEKICCLVFIAVELFEG